MSASSGPEHLIVWEGGCGAALEGKPVPGVMTIVGSWLKKPLYSLPSCLLHMFLCVVSRNLLGVIEHSGTFPNVVACLASTPQLR